jgi:hypothetical protein
VVKKDNPSANFFLESARGIYFCYQEVFREKAARLLAETNYRGVHIYSLP